MRNKQAFKNMLSTMILQVVVAITGLLLPRFFIMGYGSAMNGMISSITQFLSYLSLVEAGISAASMVELYSPLHKRNEKEVNEVLSATKSFYYRSGILYGILLLCLVIIYPTLIHDQIDTSVVRWLIVVMAASNLMDYFFIGKYKVLVTADQRMYVLNIIQAIATIFNVVITIILIQMGYNIVLVKLVATAAYILRAVFIYSYVKKNYGYLDFNVKSKKPLLTQRWDALFHQLVGTIVNSSDMILLTLLGGKTALLEISVYYLYNLVGTSLTNFFGAFSSGLTSGFGSLISENRKDSLKTAYSNYEFIYYIFLFTCYTCMWILLIPFVTLYTKNVHDINYARPGVAILFVLVGFVQNVRLPSLTMILASGHYKQTKYSAFFEALIKIVVSVLLVKNLGIIGLLIGSLCSYTYRSIDVIIYNSRNIVTKISKKTLMRVSRNALFSLLLISIVNIFPYNASGSWLNWVLYAMIVGVFSLCAIVIFNCLIEQDQFKKTLERVKGIVSK